MTQEVMLRRSTLLASLLCVFSAVIAYWLLAKGIVSASDTANGYFVTMHLFAAQDIWMGPAMAVVLLLAFYSGRDSLRSNVFAHPFAVPILALIAAALSLVLRYMAHHNYPLSIDEFMPTFQAAIFRGGNLMAPLSDAAYAIHPNLQPYFTYIDETHQLWSSHYRPVHAAILAVFPAAHDQAIAHALLSGITVFAIADIARRQFPERAEAPFLAAALLVASPQVLLTSASGFAFTTHLAFNTVWLALFLRGSWPAHIAAACVGFFAIGIHQVHVHAIYVFPFGIAMLLGYFGSRWKTVPYIVAYSISVPLWVTWPEIAVWLQTGDASVLPRTFFEVDYISNYLNFSDDIGDTDRHFSMLFLATNLWRFFLWLSPAVVLLLMMGVAGRRKLPVFPTVCVLGFAFTVLINILLMPNQMHSIGSRYFHPVLGNMILVALAVYYTYDDFPRVRSIVVKSALIGFVVFLPWRSWQVEAKVGPRAEAQAKLEALDVDSVLVEMAGIWFMPDFIRNDPDLTNRPIIYGYRGEAPPLLSDGPSVVIRGADLIEMGFPRGTLLEPAFDLSSR